MFHDIHQMPSIESNTERLRNLCVSMCMFICTMGWERAPDSF